MKRTGRILLFLSFLSLVHCGQGLASKKFSASEEASNSVSHLNTNSTTGSTQRSLPPGSRSEAIQFQVESCDLSTAACQIVERINQIRRSYRLSTLKIYKACELAAQGHAQDMAIFQYFSHRGRNGSTPAQRLEAYGTYDYVVSENIAVGDDDIDAIVQSWMDSPGHRENILDPYLTHTGVGVAISSGNTTGFGNDIYYVQCFVSNDM